MKPTVSQLQKELSNYSQKELLELCMKLTKFKKENKDYLIYLLFGSANEEQYVKEAKIHLDDVFYTVSRKTTFTTKKGLQKVVRHLNKLIKNSKSKSTEIELRSYFCQLIKKARIDLDASKIISNLYYREIDKIKTVYGKLHEDLQYDHKADLEKLGIEL